MSVIYSEEYPEILLPVVGLNPLDLITVVILTKSHVWSHEREYRLINLPMTNPPAKPWRMLDDLLKWKTPQLAVVPPRFILSVTIGASMQDREIEKILRICHDRTIAIPVFQGKCRQDRFDLEFEQIA